MTPSQPLSNFNHSRSELTMLISEFGDPDGAREAVYGEKVTVSDQYNPSSIDLSKDSGNFIVD
ncbi:hypothetical protein PGT21_003406 [Puccinia graminis f. sp. tritici]|uniref:Uncharacterized protein n=1 Tax=Puccinia graminis f. sp. tritici TaxID=56615 RepID=A0A5B0M378_PUCGR|nr:hypothetical protein PGT21_003406 [Puccinia graminis f. sp. tritici]